MNGGFCPACGMEGCGSRLCRVCRLIAVRMNVIRYPLTPTGEADKTQPPVRGRICGIITGGRIYSRRGGRLEIEGRYHGGANSDGRTLTLIAATLSELKAGDILSGGGKIYRVTDGGGIGDILSLISGGDG